MIRQLPKLSLPSFIQKYTGEAPEEVHSHTNATDVKIYDMITASTVNNSEGNTMQLQLFQKDSEINEGVRELHGRITLNTENLPDKQDLNFGFMFTDSQSGSKYDGLQVLTRVHHEFNEGRKQKFAHIDVSSTSKPDIYDVDIQRDSQHDWVILEDESSVTCEDVGRCEFSVAFVRNFDTMDTKQDIAFQEGEEHEYAFTGFYRAKSIANGDITHIGQSQEMFILCGALNVLTSTTLAVASAVIALTAF
jgi:hypothetical protein